MNNILGKIENGKIIINPNPIWIGKVMHSNPTKEMLIENGYKPVEFSEQPQKEGFYYTPNYIDVGNKIIQMWEAHLIEFEV